MSSLKAQVGEKEASAIRKRLALWARDKNPACADCGRANPTWASVNLGVLVCLECAGRHRSLGVHVSKMRSISLDTVLPGEARFLVSMNNALANKWWEAQLNPNEKANVMKSAGFIEQKYTHRKWVLQDPSIPTPTADNVPHTHPWWEDSQCSNSVPPLSPPPFPAQIQTPILARSREPGRTSSTPPRPQHTPAEDLIDFGDFSLDDGPAKAPSTGHTRDAFAAPRASAPCGDPFEASESKSVSHKASSSPGGDPFTMSHPTGGYAGFPAQSEMPSKMPVPARTPSMTGLQGLSIAQSPSSSCSQLPEVSVPSAGNTGASVMASSSSQSKKDLHDHILSLYNTPSQSQPQHGAGLSLFDIHEPQLLFPRV